MRSRDSGNISTCGVENHHLCRLEHRGSNIGSTLNYILKLPSGRKEIIRLFSSRHDSILLVTSGDGKTVNVRTHCRITKVKVKASDQVEDHSSSNSTASTSDGEYPLTINRVISSGVHFCTTP